MFSEEYDKMKKKTRRAMLGKGRGRLLVEEEGLNYDDSISNGSDSGGQLQIGRFPIGDWAKSKSKSKVACDRIGSVRNMSTGRKDDGPELEHKIKEKDSDTKEKVDKTRDDDDDDEDTPVDRIKTKCGISMIKEAKPPTPEQSPS